MESSQPIILNSDEGEGLELLNIFDKMKAVKAFVFDVDGVFTDNSVLVTEAGELLRIMNVRDGQALRYASDAGYPMSVITGGRSEGAKKRLLDLGVTEYYGGIKDKNAAFNSFLQRTGLGPLEVCYFGDDVPDIPVMKRVLLAACPQDAVPEVSRICDYISPLAGGKGCVRDLVEKIMKLQGKWPTF